MIVNLAYPAADLVLLAIVIFVFVADRPAAGPGVGRQPGSPSARSRSPTACSCT